MAHVHIHTINVEDGRQIVLGNLDFISSEEMNVLFRLVNGENVDNEVAYNLKKQIAQLVDSTLTGNEKAPIKGAVKKEDS
jgi:hypothetical protein